MGPNRLEAIFTQSGERFELERQVNPLPESRLGVGRRRPRSFLQIAAQHADPRTTMRYDRARKNLDRHPNCNVEPECSSNRDVSWTRQRSRESAAA